MGPLAGLRILDMTTVLMGPYATQLLADLGADVVKVEPPEGDIIRQVGAARHPGMGGLFLHANRNKRSIVLDLKRAEDRDAFLEIAARCDAVVYNVRPQAMERLRLSYEDVKAVNPGIVYLGVFGFGETGAYAGRPAYDDLIQGASGLASLVAEHSGAEPRYAPVALADRVVGIYAATCLLAAVHHRERTGVGQRVDVPMFETMTSFVMGDHLGGLTFDPPLDPGRYTRLVAHERRPYQTKDGHICTLIYNDRQWRNFLRAIGREDVLDDPRFADHASRSANIASIYEQLSRIFTTKTSAEWTALLEAADIPVMPLHTLESITEDPHLTSVGFFQPAVHPTEGAIRTMKVPSSWSETRPETVRLAPNLGEHTAEILAEFAVSRRKPE